MFTDTPIGSEPNDIANDTGSIGVAHEEEVRLHEILKDIHQHIAIGQYIGTWVIPSEPVCSISSDLSAPG